MIKNVSVIFCLLVMSGCAGVQPSIPKNAEPDSKTGYIGGDFFNASETFISGFLVKNITTSEEFVLSFVPKPGESAIGREVPILAVKPGRYKITDWLAYNRAWGTRGGSEIQRPISTGPLAVPFDVLPNEIVFLGKFKGHTKWTPEIFKSTTRSAIDAQTVSKTDAENIVRSEYPAFGNMRIQCITCDQ